MCGFDYYFSPRVDPLAQLVVDSSRQILYSRSYGDTITVSPGIYSHSCEISYSFSKLGKIFVSTQVSGGGGGGEVCPLRK